ncbi:Aste57867_3368 [Aphanomyces stellatus]|uniref:Aste57867_3368 protein n=1 Tax=Aphanomyces stellatus TaxID=120398 RepID=A0A485KAK4_9STRA|nr:hypothetical protein As57867_003358 [Aphanomyces stellatus]VFT80534.1 Aste57867_3368 [Aphanomyces stellatus]
MQGRLKREVAPFQFSPSQMRIFSAPVLVCLAAVLSPVRAADGMAALSASRTLRRMEDDQPTPTSNATHDVALIATTTPPIAVDASPQSKSSSETTFPIPVTIALVCAATFGVAGTAWYMHKASRTEKDTTKVDECPTSVLRMEGFVPI